MKSFTLLTVKSKRCLDEICYADEIPCGDEIRLSSGWVDLISSEAKAEDFIRACEDFIVQSTISSKTQGSRLDLFTIVGIINTERR